MKIKTANLTGPALDWAVCIAEGMKPEHIYISAGSRPQYTNLYRRNVDEDGEFTGTYTTGPDLLFSRKWEAGGPLIEREGIAVQFGPQWTAVHHKRLGRFHYGTTPLIAAMRAYVASRLGDEVDVPEELLS